MGEFTRYLPVARDAAKFAGKHGSILLAAGWALWQAYVKDMAGVKGDIVAIKQQVQILVTAQSAGTARGRRAALEDLTSGPPVPSNEEEE